MNQSETVILVVDDDKEIREGIRIYLELEGYQVLEAPDGQIALDILAENLVHLIVLDIMMPNLDGIMTTHKIRQDNNVPILMLSAKNEDLDKINGLQVGADDYLTKPFSPMELLARVKSMLRRYFTLGEFEKELTGDEIILSDLRLNLSNKMIYVNEREIRLTKTEFEIVKLLMSHPGRVFSTDNIYETVWNEPSFNSDNTVSVHVRKIREKIENDPKKPKYLKVVWGIGYKMEK
ncbi:MULTISPECIES: response regulator transcription factor [Vagococcus]|uniref:Phosphate regulon transcriptional regulatory protein PhoB (SphR) n=1 Tax=Vagococcus fluvialis bH819 TaxID=1255619 RepID=A0A1X6WLB2_9ENTE|nr:MULTISPECIES: response regulator transcription factor [Vagococcus]SLM85057.1 Phosphate regulon transcriptional regulatory protein PhoB (SphR) [Vagococcus fluvialis bH819]HCM88527.1 DNA-binding response regulator [Vagococcus sp.]